MMTFASSQRIAGAQSCNKKLHNNRHIFLVHEFDGVVVVRLVHDTVELRIGKQFVFLSKSCADKKNTIRFPC